MTKASKVDPRGYTGFLEREAKNCPPAQFIREYKKNATQAIQRYIKEYNDPSFKGQVEIDVDWLVAETEGSYKMTITDNGIGMTGPEMESYVNDLASSSDLVLEHENFGIGAKISSAVKNRNGIRYESWKDGKGAVAVFWFDPVKKIYGLRQWNEDGENKYWLPITVKEEDKPSLIKDHGTKITLFGCDDRDNTFDPDYYGIKNVTRESWVASYLNKRFYRIPENISVKARIGWYRPKENSKHNYLREIVSLEETLEKHTLEKGRVKLSDCVIEWRILNHSPDGKKRDGHGREFVNGHTAIILENEVFEISFGKGNKSKNFGIYIGQNDIVLHIFPSSKNYVQTSNRASVILRGEDSLPWEKWQDEFEQSFPKQLEEFLKKKMSETENLDDSKKINDRLKEFLPFYSIPKFKKSNKGTHLVNEKDLVEGSTGGVERVGKPKEKPQSPKDTSKRGNNNDLVSSLVSLVSVDDGTIPAVKSNPNPFPEVTWVEPEEDESFTEELKDRAALFREKQNIVFANKQFSGFLQVIEHFCKTHEHLPAQNISMIVKEVFAQQLMETVASVTSFKFRANWEDEDYQRALSPEALTASVGSRMYFMQNIKRRLSDPKLKIINESD